MLHLWLLDVAGQWGGLVDVSMVDVPHMHAYNDIKGTLYRVQCTAT